MIVCFTFALLRQPEVTFADGNVRIVVTRDMPRSLSKIRDLDGNGIPEIVIGYNGGVLVADALGGEVIWEVRNFQYVFTVRTISKGATDYIVVRHLSSNNSHVLSMLSAEAREVIWSRIVGESGYPELKTIVVPDVDADGWPEVCLGGSFGNLVLV